MVMVNASEVSLSVSKECMSRSIAVSSVPAASSAVRVGESATAATVTGSLVWLVALTPPVSVAVMERPSTKSVSLSSGAVIVNPSSSASVTVQVPSALSIPAESLAPLGTLLIVMAERVSEPSRSVRAVLISSSISLSSYPFAARACNRGASAAAATETLMVALVEALSPSRASAAVAVTSSVKS